MPLTLAHPAIVLPLCKCSKKWVSSTALILGSMSPDLEYLFHLLPNRTYGHLYFHAWWFDLFITLALAFVFHKIVRNSLIENLPPFLSQRFSHFRNFNWTRHFIKHFHIIIVSAWIGIYSHILWDEFTHKGTHIVETYSFFKIHLTTILGQDIFVYNFLQHTSSIVGTIIVFTILLSFKRDTNAFINTKWIIFWLSSSIIAISLLTIKVWMISAIIKPNIHFLSMLFLTAATAFSIGLIVTSLIYSFRKKNAFSS